MCSQRINGLIGLVDCHQKLNSPIGFIICKNGDEKCTIVFTFHSLRIPIENVDPIYLHKLDVVTKDKWVNGYISTHISADKWDSKNLSNQSFLLWLKRFILPNMGKQEVYCTERTDRQNGLTVPCFRLKSDSYPDSGDDSE